MIDNINLTAKHIEEIRKKFKVDPIIVERSIFAFKLVENLITVGADFIFKGGTSLMVLLDKPLRFSTDVDIVVEPNYDIDKFIELASKITPYKDKKEIIREGKGNIVKRHFKFIYESPIANKDVTILLDVLFEKNHYSKTITKELKSEYISTIEPKIFVKLPSIDSILGDKLTAFAPKTCGIIPIEKREDKDDLDKRTEVIKQMFDVASLFDYASDFKSVFDSYVKTANSEINYRNLKIDYTKCLEDSFNCALCIFSKGKINPNDYNAWYIDGIRKLKSFVMNTRFDGETAYKQAAKVMILCSSMLTNLDFKSFNYKDLQYELVGDYSKLNFMKKIDIEFYDIARYAIFLYESKYKNAK